MSKLNNLYSIIDATIGADANRDQPLYHGSPIADVARQARIAMVAIKNRRLVIAGHLVRKISRALWDRDVLDATGTLADFCAAAGAEIDRLKESTS